MAGALITKAEWKPYTNTPKNYFLANLVREVIEQPGVREENSVIGQLGYEEKTLRGGVRIFCLDESGFMLPETVESFSRFHPFEALGLNWGFDLGVTKKFFDQNGLTVVQVWQGYDPFSNIPQIAFIGFDQEGRMLKLILQRGKFPGC